MMSSGQIITISAIVAALTSAGTFFGLRHVVGGKKTSGAAAPISTTPTSTEPEDQPLATSPKPMPTTPTTAAPAPVPEKVAPSAPAVPQTPSAPPTEQEPPPSRVSVTVRGAVTVPKVTGKWAASASRILKRAKLQARVSYRYDEDHSEGLVLSQRPAAGSKVAVGSSVRIIVNKER